MGEVAVAALAMRRPEGVERLLESFTEA